VSPTANCRSGKWHLTTLKDFLNTFYQEPVQVPMLATQQPPP
jgi:hypothetical protein